MKNSISFGIQNPESGFEKRPVQCNPGSASYMGNPSEQPSQPHYAKGDRSKNPRSSANYATQSKSQGLTGRTKGSGNSNFRAKGSSSGWSPSGGMQRKGFAGQKKGK